MIARKPRQNRANSATGPRNGGQPRPPAMEARTTLAGLLEGIAQVPRDVALTDLTLDSRTASHGGLFLACRGIASHGLEHVERALLAGVSAVAWEPAPGVPDPDLPESVVSVRVPALGRHVGRIADRFFGSPSAGLRIAAITGTNGKTTVAWLLAQAFSAVGRPAGYSGTLGFGPVGSLEPATHTTPDCVTVHRQLSHLRAAGVHTLGMEVSSHALAQERVSGVRFDTALFTNLSRDHLDYHQTMEAYGEAKARLFGWPGLNHRVINVNDAFGRRLCEQLPASASYTAVCAVPGDRGNAVDATRGNRFVHATGVAAVTGGLQIGFDSSWGSGRLSSRLIGEFNAENLLLALATMLLWEVPASQAIAALESSAAPPGRMETFGDGVRTPLVVVDYAHTPDALAKALRAARAHCRGRLWCVFGCGGDRDAGKRPLMGAIAYEQADEVIVTDDNPRTEDADRIVAAIVAGMPAGSAHSVIRERARAIATAVERASADDVVVVAGKGHEEYQIYGTQYQVFSDRAEVRRLVGARA
jgi:UDP-N-acetylmuramoyl-L-alanyl-D-glutamate--2,6-diaminopimelate ligase